MKVDIVVHRLLKTRTVECYRETVDNTKQEFHEAMSRVERCWPKGVEYDYVISVEHQAINSVT